MRLSPLSLVLLLLALAGCALSTPDGTRPGPAARASSVTAAVTTSAFHVTQTTLRSQDHPSVTANGDGTFWVIWHTDEAAASYGLDVKARVFDSTGAPLGDEFLIHDVRGRNQMYPDVATDGGSLFVAVWMEQSTVDTYDVQARVFTVSGTPLTDVFRVSSYPSHAMCWPSVAMYPNGDFVVIWDDAPAEYVNVYARLYSPNGTPLSDASVINIAALNQPRDTTFEHFASVVPDVAADSSGWALGVYRRFEGPTVSVVGRLFNPYTGVNRDEVVISPPPYGVVQQRPTVDTNERGDAVVAWTEWYAGWPSRVFLRRYDAAAGIWHPTCPVVADPFYEQSKVTAVVGGSGQVVAAWTGFRSGSREDIFVRLFDPLGTPLTEAVRVNEYTTGKQDRPSIALMGSSLLAAWESWAEDGDDRGVYARILQRPR